MGIMTGPLQKQNERDRVQMQIGCCSSEKMQGFLSACTLSVFAIKKA
jgi:hypothetical protein